MVFGIIMFTRSQSCSCPSCRMLLSDPIDIGTNGTHGAWHGVHHGSPVVLGDLLALTFLCILVFLMNTCMKGRPPVGLKAARSGCICQSNMPNESDAGSANASTDDIVHWLDGCGICHGSRLTLQKLSWIRSANPSLHCSLRI